MDIGTKVKVQLPSKEWYYGKIVSKIIYFHNEIRFEIQGNVPRPFITIMREQNIVKL